MLMTHSAFYLYLVVREASSKHEKAAVTCRAKLGHTAGKLTIVLCGSALNKPAAMILYTSLPEVCRLTMPTTTQRQLCIRFLAIWH